MTQHYDERTLLVVVDVQNDFAHPDGALYIPGGENVFGPINHELEAAQGARARIAFSRDWHPSSSTHFQPEGPWPKHCVRRTWGSDYAAGMKVTQPRWEILKGNAPDVDGYSAFHVRTGDEVKPTMLVTWAQDWAIDWVYVVGLATDYCVGETALSALELGYPVSVLSECVRGVEEESSDKMLSRIEEAGGDVL